MQRIIIDISCDDVAHIYYSVIGDERLLDIDWGVALELKVIDEPKESEKDKNGG